MMKPFKTEISRNTTLSSIFNLSGLMKSLLPSVCILGATATVDALDVKKGEHIVLLGNTLAERMQHHGWLETYAQLAMPEKALVFRNHGFSGDKVDKRPRNRGFINPHDYLTISKADVILSFFGANEAWDKNPGNYKGILSKWVDETKGKQYNGKSAPRIVLFSPIAHENLESPNLPDGKEQNKHLAAYATATAEVAKEKGVEYVDLFGPSQALYAKSGDTLTMNGIHLTNEGNNHLAQVIFKALFGKDPQPITSIWSKQKPPCWTRTGTGSTATGRPMATMSGADDPACASLTDNQTGTPSFTNSP